MEDNNQTIKEILEIVNFIKDNSASKQELNDFRTGVESEFSKVRTEFSKVRSEFESEFQKVREEIIDHVDGFAVLHQHIEIELAANVHKTRRLENHIQTIAKHLQLQLD